MPFLSLATAVPRGMPSCSDFRSLTVLATNLLPIVYDVAHNFHHPTACSNSELEGTAGVEPAWTALQTASWPLGHVPTSSSDRGERACNPLPRRSATRSLRGVTVTIRHLP
jgi:hypothetical protein